MTKEGGLKMSEAKARRNDPATSWEAAETIDVARDKRAVLWALDKLGIASDWGILRRLDRTAFYGTPPMAGTAQSLRSRRAELMRGGYVELAVHDDGTPIYGKTMHNRRCRLFRLTDKGKALARTLG